MIWRLHPEMIDWWTDRSVSQGFCGKMDGFHYGTEVLNCISYKHDKPYRTTLLIHGEIHTDLRSHWEVHLDEANYLKHLLHVVCLYLYTPVHTCTPVIGFPAVVCSSISSNHR